MCARLRFKALFCFHYASPGAFAGCREFEKRKCENEAPTENPFHLRAYQTRWRGNKLHRSGQAIFHVYCLIQLKRYGHTSNRTANPIASVRMLNDAKY